MTTADPAAPPATRPLPRTRRQARVLRAFVISDSRLFLREPLLVLFSFGLPVMLTIGLGLPSFAHIPDPLAGGLRMVDSSVPSLALTLSFAMIGLFGAPTSLAGYRETGMLRRLGTTPVAPSVVLVSQLIVGLLSALAAAVVILLLCWTVIGTAAPARPLGLVAALLAGVTALMSLGMVVAAVAPSSAAATGLAQLVLQPSCFLAGMYVPSRVLPEWLVSIGRMTPFGAFRQAVESALTGTGQLAVPLAILAAWSLVAMGLARWTFRWA